MRSAPGAEKIGNAPFGAWIVARAPVRVVEAPLDINEKKGRW